MLLSSRNEETGAATKHEPEMIFQSSYHMEFLETVFSFFTFDALKQSTLCSVSGP